MFSKFVQFPSRSKYTESCFPLTALLVTDSVGVLVFSASMSTLFFIVYCKMMFILYFLWTELPRNASFLIGILLFIFSWNTYVSLRWVFIFFVLLLNMKNSYISVFWMEIIRPDEYTIRSGWGCQHFHGPMAYGPILQYSLIMRCWYHCVSKRCGGLSGINRVPMPPTIIFFSGHCF